MAPLSDDRNFRLSRTVLPRRYDAQVSLDLEQKAFSGRQTVELSVEGATRQIVLHGISLEVQRAQLQAGGKTLTPTVAVLPQSETLVLTFGEELPVGAASLQVDWKGKFTEGLRGLYLAGKVASTQFEAADARRLFPCFDEPAFKARWAIGIEVPDGLASLGNGPIVSEEVKGGRRTVRFAETDVLSSYLIALVVGPLVPSTELRAAGIPIRTWSLPEKAHLTAFAQEVAAAVLPRLADYFGLPYAYGKVDQVGIPDFEAGAMENAGLITYRETALLLDPATAPLSVQKRVAEVITHELAHQWFGNWVTMVWWDDLWLNEAFATWMAYKIVDPWRPQWRVWLDFDNGKAVALHLDALRSTHPIRGEVHNANEAGEAFDAITYEKGGAVLRMIENFLGEAGFRDGIRAYMKQHARGNAVADDLWSALAAASSQPVLEVANAWIRKSGYPLLSVSLSGRSLKVSQARFYSEPGVSSEETWPVPLVIRYRDAGGIREHRVLLQSREQTLQLPGEGEIAWVCGNGHNTGFYRVAYDASTLKKISAGVQELSPAERGSLIADQWALVRAGRSEIGAFLELAQGFAHEQDYAVLDELVGKLAYVQRRLTEGQEEVAFRAFVEKLFAPQLERLGWDPAPGESDDVKLQRASLVYAVGGIARSPSALREAQARVTRLLGGDAQALEPNLQDVAFGMCARAGDALLFDTLEGKFPGEPDPAIKRRYLMALSAFEDPKLAQRGQELFFGGKVPMQDTAGFVNGLLANRTARDAFWKQIQQRWDEVIARTGSAPMILRRVVEAMGALITRAHLTEAQAHFAAHPVEEAKQATGQTLERLSQDVALRERVMKDVAAFLSR